MPITIETSGKTYTKFTCSYPHAGTRWEFSVYALDFADAEARLAAIGNYGQVDGAIECEIPVDSAEGPVKWYVQFRCWWHNLWLKR